jgi:hypothetical protein
MEQDPDLWVRGADAHQNDTDPQHCGRLKLLYLEILLLEVGPEPLDDLAPGQLLVLLGADDGGQGRGQGHRLREAVHLEKRLLNNATFVKSNIAIPKNTIVYSVLLIRDPRSGAFLTPWIRVGKKSRSGMNIQDN